MDYVATYGLADPYTIDPPSAVAVRDDRYKLVENTDVPYTQGQPCPASATPEYEFYEINEDSPAPRLDEVDTNFDIDNLTPEQQLH